MVDIARIAPHLQRRSDGIWVGQADVLVSYPRDGNRDCLEIEHDSFWFSHRNACILSGVHAFPPSGAIFDIGGGNGVVSLALQQEGFEVALIEPGQEGAQNAHARGIEDVLCCALEDAGIRPNVLTAVGLFDVLEHIEDDVGFMREVARIVIPGGRIYLTCPAHRFLWSVEDDYAGHYTRYTKRTLAATLRSAGITLEFFTYIFAWLPLPIFVLRTVPSWLGLRAAASRRQQAREHQLSRGPLTRLLGSVLAPELRAIQRRAAIPFGGSCLAVARVPTEDERSLRL